MKVTVLLVVGLVFCSITIFAESSNPTGAPVPEGMRAVTIHVGVMTLMNGNVKTGDRVDILTTDYYPLTKQQVTKMILQNIPVLVVEREKTDPSSNDGAETSITLAVPPQESVVVVAADRAGVLRISLRHVKGETPEQTPVLRFREAQKALEKAFAYIDAGKVQFKDVTVKHDDVEPLSVSYGFDNRENSALREKMITVDFRVKSTIRSNYAEYVYEDLLVHLDELGRLVGASTGEHQGEVPTKQWKILPHQTP